MAQLYNAPPGTPSDIGPQFNTHYWDRRSLIDAAEQMFFSPLADVRSMPMHYGKELKVYYYVPLLDDRNVNDQGLDAAGAVMADGNMYGSSKDVGTISSRMPTLTEEGGRVNRVGFTRLERSGTLQEHGFFTEFSEDMMTFDTDSDLYGHMSREMVAGANEITEDLLQIDLLSNAGTVVYTGVATQDSEITGEGANPSVVTYMDLKKLSIVLDDNRTPKNTKIIKGSTMNDTATINASRIMYIGSELQITVENLTDGLGNPAFVPVRKYAAASTIMNGEIGSVGDFRVIVVPNMMNWEGAGAVATGANLGYSDDGSNYNIFPMLVVGDGSFATVGLQGSGKKGAKQKFKIIVKKPGKEMATVQDPYGKIGFSSITFYHGFIALRPERLAVVKTVAAE
jgi:N4-gp56 family major capsid protein